MMSVWYQLVDSTGRPCKDICSSSVSLPTGALVVQLREIVVVKNPRTLSDVDASQLRVYTTLDDLTKEPRPSGLASDRILADHGSCMQTALIVVVPSPKYTTALFQLFEWLPIKRRQQNQVPSETVTLDLHDGRLPIRSLLQLPPGDAKRLYRIEGSQDVLLLEDSNGFSIHLFDANVTHRIRVKRATSVDVEITFSDPKLTIHQLCEDFGINKHRLPWKPDESKFLDEMQKLPTEMQDLLGLFLQFNTMRSEASRRFLISTFLLFALRAVSHGNNPQCIDEESPLACIRPRTQDSTTINVKYSGPADFIIGHSRTDRTIPADATVLVIEVKKDSTYDDAYRQVLAQAATALMIRQEYHRGVDGSGGPVFFIRTDGLRWGFSKMASKDGELCVQDSDTLNLLIDSIEGQAGKTFRTENLMHVFSWVVHVVELSRQASPRTSLVEVDDSSTTSTSTIIEVITRTSKMIIANKS